MSDIVLTTVSGNFATVTLNTPANRNALSPAMRRAILDALESLKDQSSVRSIVITGSGTAFCSGLDLAALAEISGKSAAENLADSQSIADFFAALITYPKPLIAYVNGPAYAGGAGLAVLCDVTLVDEFGSLCFSEVRIGFIPAVIGAYLVQFVGVKTARELMLSARAINGQEAVEVELATRVIERSKVKDEISVWTSRFAQNGPQAMKLVKEWIAHDVHYQTSGMELAIKMNAEVRGSSECREGIAAFLSKRAPQW